VQVRKGIHLSRRAFVQRLVGIGASISGLALLGGCELVSPVVRGSTRTPRIGALFGSSAEGNAAVISAWQQGLRDGGWVDGQNIAVEWRFAEGHNERFPELAAELVNLPVDVLFVPNTLGVDVARHVTATIPIVMTDISDPVGRGLVTSLASPGANVTGLAGSGLDDGKRLEVLCDGLKSLVTTEVRVAVLGQTSGADPLKFESVRAAASALNVAVILEQFDGPEDFDAVLEQAVGSGADGLLVLQSPNTVINTKSIVCVGRRASAACDVFRSHLRRRGWLDELRFKPSGDVPPISPVHRSHPQGCESCRAPNSARHYSRIRGKRDNC
jgi:ABC-type uncharacterized transport system substrate-binding protein